MNRILIARELIRVAKLLLSYVKPQGYGAWLKDDGKPLYVEYQEHMNAVQEHFGQKYGYNDAYRHGWIRVIFEGPKLKFVLGNKRTKALDALEDLIYFGKFEYFYGESPNSIKDVDTKDPEEAFEFARKNL